MPYNPYRPLRRSLHKSNVHLGVLDGLLVVLHLRLAKVRPVIGSGSGSRVGLYLEAHTLPLFLGRLLFEITDPNHKTRYPKKGVGYEPLGRA